jgi:hypothetical protein
MLQDMGALPAEDEKPMPLHLGGGHAPKPKAPRTSKSKLIHPSAW